jgi:hypothetical protein
MKFNRKEDLFEDIRKQISEWKIIPSKIMLDLETFHELFRSEISWLYKYILKYNYFIRGQETIRNGYQIKLFNNNEVRTLYLCCDNFNVGNLNIISSR